MRLALDSRRLIGRAREVSGWTLLEAALLALIALQGARLVWTLATPVGPLGGGPVAQGSPTAANLLAGFDPFFRLAGGGSGPATVTSLNLKLFGVRQDQASGRGSAIIATSDGQQRSFAVGDEIEPGVVLKAVGFDHVTIARGGQDEQLFMDQGEAPPSGGAAAVSPPTPVPPSRPVPPPPGQSQPSQSVEPGGPPIPASRGPQVSARPRTNGAQVTGLALDSAADRAALRTLGLAPGDVITAINGRRIRTAAEAQALAADLGASRSATLEIERAGRRLVLRAGAGR